MPRRRSRIWSTLALVLCAVASACGGSHAKTYSARDVRDALRQQGFKVEIVSDEVPRMPQRQTVIGLLRLFSGSELKRDGVKDLVANPSSGSGVWAWILDTERRADSWERGWSRPNKDVARLQRRNVVVVVAKRREAKARAALAALH